MKFIKLECTGKRMTSVVVTGTRLAAGSYKSIKDSDVDSYIKKMIETGELVVVDDKKKPEPKKDDDTEKKPESSKVNEDEKKPELNKENEGVKKSESNKENEDGKKSDSKKESKKKNRS